MDNSDMTSLEDWRLSKVKEYGKEALLPFVDLLVKYQEALLPYLRFLSQGLHAGGDNLSAERSPSQVHAIRVAEYFLEASKGIDELIRILEKKDIDEMRRILTGLGNQRPGLAFSASYVAGLFVGRLFKHIVGEKKGTAAEVKEPPFQSHIQ